MNTVGSARRKVTEARVRVGRNDPCKTNAVRALSEIVWWRRAEGVYQGSVDGWEIDCCRMGDGPSWIWHVMKFAHLIAAGPAGSTRCGFAETLNDAKAAAGATYAAILIEGRAQGSLPAHVSDAPAAPEAASICQAPPLVWWCRCDGFYESGVDRWDIRARRLDDTLGWSWTVRKVKSPTETEAHLSGLAQTLSDAKRAAGVVYNLIWQELKQQEPTRTDVRRSGSMANGVRVSPLSTPWAHPRPGWHEMSSRNWEVIVYRPESGRFWYWRVIDEDRRDWFTAARNGAARTLAEAKDQARAALNAMWGLADCRLDAADGGR